MDLLWNILGLLRFVAIPFVAILCLALYAHSQGGSKKPLRETADELLLFVVAGVVFVVVSTGTKYLLGKTSAALPYGQALMFFLNLGLVFLIGLVGGSKEKAKEFAGLSVAFVVYFAFVYPWILKKLEWSTASWGF